MILTALLATAGVIAGVSLIARFWNNITEWIKKATQKVIEVVQTAVLGFKVFIKKLAEGFKEISKHYSKNGVKWQETIVTREIPIDEVPDEILEKAGYNETDITDEYEMALRNAS